MTDYTKTQPCGCSLDGRCAVHSAMMREVIDRAKESGDPFAFREVGRFADGFGEPGFEMGDTSAWRDSSIPAVERMYAESLRFTAPPRCGRSGEGRGPCAQRIGHVSHNLHTDSEGYVFEAKP